MDLCASVLEDRKGYVILVYYILGVLYFDIWGMLNINIWVIVILTH